MVALMDPPASTADGTSAAELLRVVAIVLGAVVLARAVGRTEDVLRLVALAGTAAVLSVPLVRLLSRRLPRGVAAAITALVTFVVVVAVLGVVLRYASMHADHLSQAITARLESLRPGTLPERVARSLDLRTAVDQSLSRLPASVLTGEDGPVGVARRSIDVLLIVILAAFFQTSAPGVLDGLVRLRPKADRFRLRTLAAAIECRAGRHVRRAWTERGTLVLGPAVGVLALAAGSRIAGPARRAHGLHPGRRRARPSHVGAPITGIDRR